MKRCAYFRALGELDGQDEAERVLQEAERERGRPLTKREIHALCSARVSSKPLTGLYGADTPDWLAGWMATFERTCMQALWAAPDPDHWRLCSPETTVQEPSQEGLTTVLFRKATLEVSNPTDFLTGIRWGQTAQVEDEEHPTGEHLLQEITSNLTNHPSRVTNDWLLGYVIGRVDALLSGRRTCPGGWRGGV